MGRGVPPASCRVCGRGGKSVRCGPKNPVEPSRSVPAACEGRLGQEGSREGGAEQRVAGTTVWGSAGCSRAGQASRATRDQSLLPRSLVPRPTHDQTWLSLSHLCPISVSEIT